MAQTLGERRHGFSFRKAFSYHDIGRISGLAVTKFGNVITCDSLRNKLVLFDEDGKYLSYLQLEGSPWDITINKDNLAFVTIQNSSKVYIIDPDILHIRLFENIPDSDAVPICLSSVGDNESYVDILNNNSYILKVDEYLNPNNRGLIKNGGSKMYSRQDKLRETRYICYPGLNRIRKSPANRNDPGVTRQQPDVAMIQIPTMTVPSDICSDDNGHIYVSGQYSHNIHRLTEEKLDVPHVRYTTASVLDIPLDSRHGIKHPVAMCFNKECTKFYISNEFGTTIQIYDVV